MVQAELEALRITTEAETAKVRGEIEKAKSNPTRLTVFPASVIVAATRYP